MRTSFWLALILFSAACARPRMLTPTLSRESQKRLTADGREADMETFAYAARHAASSDDIRGARKALELGLALAGREPERRAWIDEQLRPIVAKLGSNCATASETAGFLNQTRGRNVAAEVYEWEAGHCERGESFLIAARFFTECADIVRVTRAAYADDSVDRVAVFDAVQSCSEDLSALSPSRADQAMYRRVVARRVEAARQARIEAERRRVEEEARERAAAEQRAREEQQRQEEQEQELARYRRDGVPTPDCRFWSTERGEWIPLYGKVQRVDSFADFKIEITQGFPTLKVQRMDAFADECGEWEFVDSFPDFTVEVVGSFGDFSVEYVDAFPGLP